MLYLNMVAHNSVKQEKEATSYLFVLLRSWGEKQNLDKTVPALCCFSMKCSSNHAFSLAHYH